MLARSQQLGFRVLGGLPGGFGRIRRVVVFGLESQRLCAGIPPADNLRRRQRIPRLRHRQAHPAFSHYLARLGQFFTSHDPIQEFHHYLGKFLSFSGLDEVRRPVAPRR